MKISDNGIRLIKSFEGYHNRLPNGYCTAYLCPANVPTIGFGCTEGVKLGMVWTEEQAEAGLLKEIAKHEAAVNRLVSVDMNQNEFDALVSFSYNCGVGALGKSTLLKKLNKGDRIGAAREFGKWNKGGGSVLTGLVARREREAALFLKPTEAPEGPYMPQVVEETKEISKPVATAGGVAAGGAAVGTTSLPSLPAPPDLSPYTAWQGFGEAVASLGAWITARPLLTVLCVLWACVMAFLPRIMERVAWLRSSLSS